MIDHNSKWADNAEQACRTEAYLLPFLAVIISYVYGMGLGDLQMRGDEKVGIISSSPLQSTTERHRKELEVLFHLSTSA